MFGIKSVRCPALMTNLCHTYLITILRISSIEYQSIYWISESFSIGLQNPLSMRPYRLMFGSLPFSFSKTKTWKFTPLSCFWISFCIMFRNNMTPNKSSGKLSWNNFPYGSILITVKSNSTITACRLIQSVSRVFTQDKQWQEKMNVAVWELMCSSKVLISSHWILVWFFL